MAFHNYQHISVLSSSKSPTLSGWRSCHWATTVCQTNLSEIPPPRSLDHQSWFAAATTHPHHIGDEPTGHFLSTIIKQRLSIKWSSSSFYFTFSCWNDDDLYVNNLTASNVIKMLLESFSQRPLFEFVSSIPSDNNYYRNNMRYSAEQYNV